MSKATTVQDHRYDDITAPVNRFNRVSWGAIFAGFFVAISIQVLFSTAGLWLNAWTYEVGTDDTISGLTQSAAWWWVITGTIAIFFGAWTAGYLSGIPSKLAGSVHGLVVWGLLTVTSFYLASSALGSMLNATAYTLNSSMAALTGSGGGTTHEVVVRVEQPNLPRRGQAQPQADQYAQYRPISAAVEGIRSLLKDTGKQELQPQQLEQEAKALQDRVEQSLKQVAMNPQQAQQELKSLLDTLYNRLEDEKKALDKQALVNVLTANTELNEGEANKVIEEWTRLYSQEVKPEIQQVVDTLQSRYENIDEEIANLDERAVDYAQQAKNQIAATVNEVQEEAKETANTAIDIISSTAGWSFLVLLLGVVAGVGGGCSGAMTPVRVMADRHHTQGTHS